MSRKLARFQQILFLVLLASCSKAGSSGSSSALLTSLQGNWGVSCILDDDNNYSTFAFKFSGNTLGGGKQVFSTSDCSDTPTEEILTATFTIIGNSAAVPGASDINITKDDGTVLYTIIKVDGDKLYGGISVGSQNGSSVSTRNNQLSQRVILNRM